MRPAVLALALLALPACNGKSPVEATPYAKEDVACREAPRKGAPSAIDWAMPCPYGPAPQPRPAPEPRP